MKSLRSALLLSLFPLLSIAATCPCGATYNSQFNKCYNSVATRKSFVAAEQTCQDMDGHLVSIHNGFEGSLIMEGATDTFSSDDFWIGASDVDQEGTWTWNDGSLVNYTNWANGFPDGQDGHDCVAVQLTSGKWRSVGCFTSKPFVCEIPQSTSQQQSIASCPSPAPAPTCPPPRSFCPSEWTYFALTDSCYKGDWSTSETTCHSFDANLTSIHSEEENSFIVSIAASGYTVSTGWTCIGLHSILPDQWTWSDGTPLTYTNWGHGQPLSAYPCVALVADHFTTDDSFTFKWVCRTCDVVQRNFVCKKRAVH